MAAYFQSTQVFSAPKTTKGVNVEHIQNTKLFLKNHGNKHDTSVMFCGTEQVYTTAKPEAKGDWENRSKSTTDRTKRSKI